MSTPTSTPQSRRYSLQVIRFEGTATGAKTPNLYAKVRFGDDSRSWQTHKIKETSPSWDESFTFSSSDISARFDIRVKRSSHFRPCWSPNPCVGYVDISLEDLLKKCSNGEAKLDLQPLDGRPGPSNGTGAIYLRLECTDAIAMAHTDADTTDVPAAQVETVKSSTAELIPLPPNDSPKIDKAPDTMAKVRSEIKAVVGAIRQRGNGSSAMGEKFSKIEDQSTQLGEQSDLYTSLWALCNKIGIFADIVDKLAVVHPYLNTVWLVTSSLFRAAEKKFENDKSIVELVYTASDAFGFVCEINELPDKIQSLQSAITGLLGQTIRLCTFVKHYTSRGLAGQFLDLIGSSQKIDEFKDCFAKIKTEFAAPLALQTAFMTERISNKVDNIQLGEMLKNVDKPRPECLPGTRGEYLNTIMDWVFSDSAQNILWLHGVAGSGKSTISMTIAEQCSNMHCRGAYLYFEREKSNPNEVIIKVARELASFHHSIEKNFAEAGKTITGVASLARQFDTLLAKPLHAAAKDIIGPVVIILDALDECGLPSARGDLMRLLAEKIPELPRNFRFLITSRKERDIEHIFAESTTVLRVRLDHESSDSKRDVATYFRREMDVLFSSEEMKQSIRKDWPWDTNMRLLIDTAGGLFIWASTVVKYLKAFGIIAFRKLDKLVTDIQSHGDAKFGLDDLYSTVLRSVQIPWDDEETRIRFSNILYLILDVGVVLSTDDIDGILGFQPHDSSTLIISQLQSVLAYASESTSRIRPLHASFAEFLKSEVHSEKPWYIDVVKKREYITKRCHESFDRMDQMLHFNMCEIETSFTCNDCISVLQGRIKQKIPSELENACVYWIQQLRTLPYSPGLLSQLDRFLHYHLLSWLEVLSLIGKVDLAVSVLIDAYKWVEGYSPSLESFLRDARKLVIAFDTPISKSIPHIYLSMLPLAWPGSEVAAHYSRAIALPSKAEIVGNRSQRAPPTVFRGHTGAVTCIAYSADGKRIVSGSLDKTVIVWDSESGEVVAGPFKGHTDRVKSVGFSRDGKYIVSGSNDMTVIVWNSESGEIFRGPFVGHTGAVNCASFSPDGKHVVSGSSDHTIKVWETEIGNAISATFKGHSVSVNSVAYSPDGKYVVSGSDDRTPIVWDAQSGEVIKVLEGHTGSVLSVMSSLDGRRIVSGSDDNSIRVWERETGEPVGGPFEGHSSSVIFVAFSSNGRHIFSSSWDDTMKVWDVESGEIISSMAGENVWSAAFSPDGKRVASGSGNDTIQVVDVQADKDSDVSFEGHTGGVTSMAYSPDGKRIVSGSEDKTMIVWDVESGKVVAGPFRGHSDWINCVAYSLDGKRIVSGSRDNTLIVWDAKTGKIISGPFEEHSGGVSSAIFSPDGERVVSGSHDNTLIVWDVENGKIILGPLKGHSDSVWAVGYSPDEKHIVSGSADMTIRVWGAESGETALTTFRGHAGEVNSVAYSPDGKNIVSGSDDRTVRVWGAESGETVAGPFDKHTRSVRSVQFSPDGKYVVSGSNDNTIIVWDVGSSKAILGPLKGHASFVRSVQFSPDGRHIASGSWDGTIRIWDVKNAVAPSASAETSTHQNWTLSDDGWVLGQEGELLIWIPPDMRTSLCYPRNTAVMNRFVTKLHFTERGMGQNWHECFDPQKLLTVE